MVRRLFSLGTILFLLPFINGCGIDINLTSDLEITIQSKVTILSPKSGEVFADPEVEKIKFEGQCSKEHTEVVLVYRERIMVECEEGLWSLSMDSTRFTEGENKIVVESTTGEILFETTFIKSFMPDHVFFKKQVRDISTYQQLHYSPSNNKNGAMVYTSDEYCIVLGCSENNVVLRLDSENHETPYYLTTDMEKTFYWPRVSQISSNTLRIFYIGTKSTALDFNIYYKDFDLSSKTFSTAKAITNFGDNSMVNSLQLEQLNSKEIVLSYISDEYCSENSCALNRAVVRSSKDNFVTRKFFGTSSDCNVDTVRSAVRKNNQKLYVFYSFQRNTGSCTVWQNYFNYSTFNGAIWSASQDFTNGRNPGSAHFAVDNNGNIFTFHHSTWHAGCGSWALFYGSSQDNFSSVNFVPGTCEYNISYPNENYRPSTIVDGNGDIVLLTSSYGAATPADSIMRFIVSKSTDGFSTPYSFYESDFAGNAKSVYLTYRNNRFYAGTMLSSGPHSGVNLFKLTSSFSSPSRHQINGPANNMIDTVQLPDQSVAEIGQSNLYCENLGTCSNNNFYLQKVGTQIKTWLTEISDDSIILSYPLYTPRTGLDDYFIYSSNELNPKKLSSRFKVENDNFSSANDFGNIDIDTLPIITSVDVDGTGTIYASGSMVKAQLFTSLDGFTNHTQINTDSLGSSPDTGVVRADGEYAVTYGSNGGGWRGRFRWSIDAFAADQYVSSDSSIKYGGWTPLWRPDNDLEVFLLTDSDSDSRVDIARINSSDNFGTLETFISFTDKTVCRSFTPSGSASEPFLKAKYDASNRLNILYSAMTGSSPTCDLYLKRSDDWNKTWKITTTEGTSLEPKEIYFRSGQEPIVCAQSLSQYYCMDLDSISPSVD